MAMLLNPHNFATILKLRTLVKGLGNKIRWKIKF